MSELNIEYMRQIDFEREGVPIFYLDKTCGGCPENHDVYVLENEKLVYKGYLYVRYGGYRVCNVDNDVIANPEIKGDGLFEYEEREHMLKLGCSLIYKDERDKKSNLEDFDYGL